LKNLKYLQGIEIGSTHKYQKKIDLKNIILSNVNDKEIHIHNFFPPTKNKNFVLNIASDNNNIRKQSIKFAIKSIDFCKSVGAKVYTIHPGFLSDAKPNINLKKKSYDFIFGKIVSNYHNSFSNMISSLREILRYSKKSKIKLAIETEGSTFKHKYLLMQKPLEYIKLFKCFPNDLYLNFNLSHSILASIVYKFSLNNFIKKFKKKIICVEISHNDEITDQHLPINKNSKCLKYLTEFKNIPKILEFRNSTVRDLKKSILILKKNI
jgi:endonuclease IV